MKKIEVSRWKDYYANYDIKYMAEVTHKGLNEHRVLTDRDEYILENKINNLSAKWDKKWQTLKAKNEKARLISDFKKKAEFKTNEAEQYIHEIENILKSTLEIDDTIDWSSIKNNSLFQENKPAPPVKPFAAKPNKNHIKYHPKFDFWDKVFKYRKNKKLDDSKELFQSDQERFSKYEEEVTRYEKLLKAREIKKKEFYRKRDETNNKVDNLKRNYLEGDTDAIEEYCDLVLSKSDYPSLFPQSFELQYTEINKSLVIDYWLPQPAHMPSIKEVKFIQSRKELKEVPVSKTQRNKYYDSTIYQISLRTLHELFEADVVEAIELITFNGWVSFINKSNGQKEESCIISIQSTKTEFEKINLEYVDPKECFKALGYSGPY